MNQFLDGAATFREEMGADWDDAWTYSDTMLALTPDEAQRLMHEVTDLVRKYRTAEPGALEAPDARVAVQWQVLPQVPKPLEEDQP